MVGGWAVTARGRGAGATPLARRISQAAQLAYLLRLSAASLPRQICEKS